MLHPVLRRKGRDPTTATPMPPAPSPSPNTLVINPCRRSHQHIRCTVEGRHPRFPPQLPFNLPSHRFSPTSPPPRQATIRVMPPPLTHHNSHSTMAQPTLTHHHFVLPTKRRSDFSCGRASTPPHRPPSRTRLSGLSHP